MMGHLALGRAAELDGRLGEAERELARAGALSRRGAGDPRAGCHGAGPRPRARRARASRDRARARLAHARALLSRCADAGILARALRQAEHAPGLGAARAPAGGGDELSERELGVLRLLHSELSLRDIGAELFLSLNTIKTHTRNIYLKLGAGGPTAVAAARASWGCCRRSSRFTRVNAAAGDDRSPLRSGGSTHARGRTPTHASGPGG